MGPDASPPFWFPTSSLSVIELTQTSLVLKWTGAGDEDRVTSYRVFQGSNLLVTLPGYVYNYSVVGLTPGIRYEFKVEAGDLANNWSRDGPSVSVTTPATLPRSPVQTPLMFWQQYWYLLVAASAAVVVSVSLLALRIKRPNEI